MYKVIAFAPAQSGWKAHFYDTECYTQPVAGWLTVEHDGEIKVETAVVDDSGRVVAASREPGFQAVSGPSEVRSILA
jgi:hypothetical protein